MRQLLIMLMALVISISATQAQQPAANVQTNSEQDYKMGKAMETFFNLFRSVNMFYVDTTAPDKMVKTAIDAMLDELDPYTEYIPENQMDDFDFMTTGKYAGIGSLIRQRGAWVEISEPYKGTPSDRAGMKAGDRLVEIDGVSLKNLGSEKVSSMLKGEANTTFRLKYVPIKDTTKMVEVVITREKILVPSVPYSGYIKDSIGYIRFTNFTEDGARQVREAYHRLRSTGNLKGLIIDLRGNGGGIVDGAIDIAGMFIPEGSTVTTLQGRTSQSNKVYKSKHAPVDLKLPLAVLINSSSASASEILAGALQDMDRAVIIGNRSFGKGLVQTTRPVTNNSLLKITIAKYYTPSGRCIQAIDYTHRNDDGSVKHIPDSLIREFKTLAGRKVYDGGGINPDIKTKNQLWSKFVAILMAYGFVDDFANIYAAKNPAQPLKTFKVDDKIYNQFTAFMADKSIDYTSPTQTALNELKKQAQNEKYLDQIKELVDSIEAKIKDDKNALLKSRADEVKEVLSNAIITRWYYNSGANEYTLLNSDDNDLNAAIETLSNPQKYNKILKEQDTSKN